MPGVRQIQPIYLLNGGTVATGINDNGEIVGDWLMSSGVTDGFTYSNGAFTNTVITDFSTVTAPYGVNDSGEISGFTINYTPNGSTYTEFLYDGAFTPINFPGATETIVQGINNSGEVVGWYTSGGQTHGFTYHNGTYLSVDYPGASVTELFGINNNGEIVGTYTCSSGDCPFSDPAFFAVTHAEWFLVHDGRRAHAGARKYLPAGRRNHGDTGGWVARSTELTTGGDWESHCHGDTGTPT